MGWEVAESAAAISYLLSFFFGCIFCIYLVPSFFALSTIISNLVAFVMMLLVHNRALVPRRNQVYTMGEGDGGRLGHGDLIGRTHPTLVKALPTEFVLKVYCRVWYSAGVGAAPPSASATAAAARSPGTSALSSSHCDLLCWR